MERGSQGGELMVGLVNFMILVTFLYLGLRIWKITDLFSIFAMILIFVKKRYIGNYDALVKIMTDVLFVFNAVHINPVLYKVL